MTTTDSDVARSGPADRVVVPATAVMRSMWLHEQLDPGGVVNHLSNAFRHRGAIEADLLEAAIRFTVDRHELLRSTIDVHDGEPVVRVHESMDVALERVAVSNRDDEWIGEFVRTWSLMPFDLADGPLCRFVLLEVSPVEQILVLGAHHLVSDMWSFSSMGGEIGAAYVQLSEGAEPSVSAPRSTFADHVERERAYVRSEKGAQDLAFWQSELTDVGEVMELPTDRPRRGTTDRRGAVFSVGLGSERTQAVRDLAHRLGSTPYSVLFAAYSTLLARMTRRSDIAVHMVKAGRSVRTAQVQGCFVNPSILRVGFDDSMIFTDLVAQIDRTITRIAPHERYPLQEVVERDRERGPAGRPYSRLAFLWQKTTKRFDRGASAAAAAGRSGVHGNFGGVELETVFYGNRVAPYDVALLCAEVDDEYTIAFEYCSALFDEASIVGLARCLETLLDAAIGEPSTAVGCLDVLDPRERRRFVDEWTPAHAAVEDPLTVTQLFGAAVARHPGKIAVSCGDATMTYSELDRRAGELAHRLRRRGVGRGSLVGVFVDRGIDMVVAVVGVLQSGGAFVPLDPDQPAERLQFMIDDADLAVVISGSSLDAGIVSQSTEVISMDQSSDETDETDESDGAAGDGRSQFDGDEPSPGDLAYALFTSGSTGRPKAVGIEHASLSGLFRTMRDRPGIGADDVVLAQTTLAFDMSIVEILLPLVTGASLVVVTRDVALDGRKLQRVLDRHGVTIMQATPSLFQLLIEDGWSGGESLTLWCGGETMPPALAQRLIRRSQRLWNTYGPTETTVKATFMDVTGEWSADDGSIPLGYAVEGKALYVLDRHLAPVPRGGVGELAIGGAGIGQGYLGRPELTKQRFLPDPFASDPEARMYRTGDLVRRLPSGVFEFHGRCDSQVKIRGVRIELGEVEAALATCSGVDAAAATVHTMSPGDQRLVGYVVASDQDDPPDADEVIASVSGSLAGAMVPSVVMNLAELPLTINGKLDRKRLPRPTFDDRAAVPAEPPRPGVERTIAEVWATVLGVSSIGRHDNFFHLGGHSLLATKIASRLRRRFDRQVDIRHVFEHPTIATLAASIRLSGAVEPTSFGIEECWNADGVYPLTFSQERMWFLHQLDSSSLAYNISGGLRIRDAFDSRSLRRAIEFVVARHDGLRMVFETREDEPVQRVHASSPVDFDVIDCSHIDPADRWRDVRERMERAAQRPFDLTALPLTRFALYRLSDADHALFFSQHHIISDQWSIGLLGEEIGRAYAAFRRGEQPQLDDVEIQLGQYAAWHRRNIEDHHLDRHLDYWRVQLAGLPVLELPTDRNRPPVQTSRGATINVDFDGDLYAAMERFGREQSVTPFMVMMAAFQLLLARYSGETDIAVGTPIANRNWLEGEHIIGSLVNTVVLRSTVDPSVSFRELVGEVHATSMDAFAHQDMPFARLVTELQVERDPSRSPLFQAFFNVQNAPFAAPSVDGANTSVIELEQGSAQFDISLSIATAARTAGLEYNTDLFDHERMTAMFDHFWALLGSAIADPDAPLASLTMLSASERIELAEWSMGETLEVDLSIPAHRLIEATVSEQPNAVAARCEGDEVTYAELNARANRLARHLVERGAAAGHVVGILLDRSIDMIVAVLAVMKSGAAYVPMDPASPSGRRASITEDVGMKLLLTTGNMPAPRAMIERIDIDSLDLDGYPAHDLDLTVDAEDLAYVIYTSGSTGRPKGVMTEHGNLVHYLQGARVRPGMSASDVVLAVTTLSFDPSVHELILPLVVGAHIVIVPRATAVDGAALHRTLRASGATIMQATPTTWRMMIEDGWTGTPGLAVQCGGEAMTPDLAGELCERADIVWNQYGPTESTLWATFHRVDPVIDVVGADHPVPLGRPLANTSLLVIDEQLRPVPAGVRGELCVGGPGVARGYLARPDLTDAAFIELPDAPEYGRVYRTGDVVRRDRDGRLIFEGRTDHQVKLRGHRIELGEIEAVVDRHPNVKQSVVVVHEVAAGDSRLVAFVTTPDGVTAPTASEIRSFVDRDLPAYMIPTLLVPLEEFPRTSSDKIDRGRLPEPTLGALATNDPTDAPRPGLETVVARSWSDVLGIDEIGRHDNFFNLGGHSLLAVRVFARLEREVGHDLALSALFEAPTVAGLADLITAGPKTSRWTSLVPIRPTGTDTPLFYVSPFLVSVLSLSEIAAHLPVGRPFYGLQPQGMESDDPIHDSVEEMATHYVSEMRSAQPTGPYLLGGHCAGSWVAFEMARQLQQAGEHVDTLILVDYGPPGGQPGGRLSVRDVIDRVRYYSREGRLIGAIRWPLGLLRERLVVRRIGSRRARRTAEVRARHAAAHARYQPEAIVGDAVFVRSSESAELAHRDWHLGWDQLISGTLEIETVVATHASLTDNLHAEGLASAIVGAITEPRGSAESARSTD